MKDKEQLQDGERRLCLRQTIVS